MTAKKLFRAQIAVSASLLAISSCTFCSIRRSQACINSSRIAACKSATATFNTKRKKERKTASAPIQLSLSLSLSDKKETQNIDTAHCGKQASKQATPEAPHSWFLTFKIVKNLGEELDETERQRTMSEERQWGRLWFIRAYLISYNLNELKLIDMPSSSAIRW